MPSRARLALAVALVAGLAAGSPLARAAGGDAAKGTLSLRGAGATFPAPLYEAWIQAYRRANPDVVITYEAVGSSEGQRRYLADAVDFGASDAALSDEQMARVKSGARLVPVTAGIVVLAYNMPGATAPLRLSREACAEIFAGRIKTWNDPRIRAANPGLDLPNRTIALVARQDGSGTTFALTNHLSAVSPDWRDRGPGVGNLVDWRGAAMLARGNEGVAARIKTSEYSLGYVEYHFARRLGLPMATLQNRAGRYVAPDERGGQAALASSMDQMNIDQFFFSFGLGLRITIPQFPIRLYLAKGFRVANGAIDWSSFNSQSGTLDIGGFKFGFVISLGGNVF